MQRIFRFFKRQDQLGSQVTLHYKENQGYGTVLGGCCSLFVSIWVICFIAVQFWAFFFRSTFTQTVSEDYLKRGDEEVYNVPLIDFMPAFVIVGQYEGETTNDYNNADYWTYSFLQQSRDAQGVEQTPVNITAKLCSDVIDGLTDVSDGQKESMKAELPKIDNQDVLMCPDTNELQIAGEGITDGDYSVDLSINVTIDGNYAKYVDKTSILTAQISRYFNPQEYEDKGYQDAITLNEDYY